MVIRFTPARSTPHGEAPSSLVDGGCARCPLRFRALRECRARLPGRTECTPSPGPGRKLSPEPTMGTSPRAAQAPTSITPAKHRRRQFSTFTSRVWRSALGAASGSVSWREARRSHAAGQDGSGAGASPVGIRGRCCHAFAPRGSVLATRSCRVPGIPRDAGGHPPADRPRERHGRDRIDHRRGGIPAGAAAGRGDRPAGPSTPSTRPGPAASARRTRSCGPAPPPPPGRW